MPDDIQTPHTPKFIVNPREVTKQDELRIKNWAHSVAKKYEYLLKPHKYRDFEVVVKDEVKPEDIDIKAIYPFTKNLHWMLYKQGAYWALHLMSGKKLLANFVFAQI